MSSTHSNLLEIHLDNIQKKERTYNANHTEEDIGELLLGGGVRHMCVGHRVIMDRDFIKLIYHLESFLFLSLGIL